jgi:hypothetical protein
MHLSSRRSNYDPVYSLSLWMRGLEYFLAYSMLLLRCLQDVDRDGCGMGDSA